MARVLIVRLDGVGDALVLAPLIAALLQAGHTLGGLFRPGNAALYCVSLMRTHIADASVATPELVRELREGAYDYALIASEKPQGYIIPRLAGIAHRFGFWNGWAKPFKSLWLLPQLERRYLQPVIDTGLHEVEHLFRLGAGLHGETQPTQDLARLRPLFLANELTRHGEVLVQITAKWQALGQDVELAPVLNALAQHIGGSTGIKVRCIGSRLEAELLENVSCLAGLSFESFADTRNWIAMIAGASLLVSPDTGAAHIAGMLGVPVVDVFAPQTPLPRRQRWRPWAAPTVMLSFDELGATPAKGLADACLQLLTSG